MAVLERDFWKHGGEIRFAGGPEFRLDTPPFWRREDGWRLSDAAGQTMFTLRPGALFLPVSSTVLVEPQFAAAPELPLLICLGQYMRILAQRSRVG